MALNKMKKLIKNIILSRRILGATSDSWKNTEIPKEQMKIVNKQLEMLRNDNPPSVYTILAEALNAIPRDNKLTLLDVGCASGYYSEVISTLVGNRFEYTGSDYSDAMLNLARKKYPNIEFLKLDIRNMELSDMAYDIVLSGAVIVHVKEWKESIIELARIARLYLILHRTPIINNMFYREEKKIYADVPVLYNRFNRDELMNIILGCRFSKIFEKKLYPYEKEGVCEMTYVFKRIKYSNILSKERQNEVAIIV